MNSSRQRKFKNVENPDRWPQKDRIRWVECRLQTRKDFDAGNLSEWALLDYDIQRKNLEVWLAKERDGLSWQQIVIKYFPEYKSRGKISAGISCARRSFQVVNDVLEPTNKQMLREHLEARIQDLFRCTAPEFKAFLNSVSTRKPRK